MAQNVTRLSASQSAPSAPPVAASGGAAGSLPRAAYLIDLFILAAVGILFVTFSVSTYLFQHDPKSPPNYLADFLPVIMNLTLLFVLGVVRFLTAISPYDILPITFLFLGTVISLIGHFYADAAQQSTLDSVGGGLIGLGGGFYLGVSAGQRRLTQTSKPE